MNRCKVVAPGHFGSQSPEGGHNAAGAVIGCGVYVSDYYHDWFGDYGEQEGDGVPTITREEQISETITFCRESGMIMR